MVHGQLSMALRLLVVLLAVLAVGKIAWQEHVTRTALRETVANAYRDRAARACGFEPRASSSAVTAAAWLAAERIDVRVPTESFWSWPLTVEQQAIAQPSLVLTVVTAAGPVSCTYNVVTAVATVAGG
jgi:hypothetical protein